MHFIHKCVLFVTSHEILPLHMAWFCYKCCILLFSFVLCFLQDKDWVSKSRYMLSKYPVFIDTFSNLYEDECPIDILKWPEKSLNVGRCLKLFRGVHIWWYHSRKDTIRIIKNTKKSSDNINSNKNKKLMVPIMVSLTEGCCHQGTYTDQWFLYWLSWSHHFESATATSLTHTEYVTNDYGYVP